MGAWWCASYSPVLGIISSLFPMGNNAGKASASVDAFGFRPDPRRFLSAGGTEAWVTVSLTVASQYALYPENGWTAAALPR